MKKFFDTLRHNETFLSITASLLAIIGGLLFGLIIMLVSNPENAFAGFSTILFGALEKAKSTGDVFYFATPIILTGLSVGFAFKTGLFNIGATGQFTVGAFAAIFVAVKFTGLPPFTHITLALLASMIAGALWALLPGLLKAYRNVHEVVSTIMMNYIGVHLVKYLIQVFVYNQTRNESLPIPNSARIPKWFLGDIFGRSSVNTGIFIAAIVAVIIYLILYKTTFGYELRAVGLNRDSAKYAGINENQKIVYSMMIAGALAGLAGGLVYLAGGKHIEVIAVLLPEGFDGIPVALLANSNPLGIIFSGLFIAYIKVGGFLIQKDGFVPEIINIIVSSIIYFSALSILFKDKFKILLRKLSKGGAK
jgi:simple sugar transport system permease protein